MKLSFFPSFFAYVEDHLICSVYQLFAWLGDYRRKKDILCYNISVIIRNTNKTSRSFEGRAHYQRLERDEI